MASQKKAASEACEVLQAVIGDILVASRREKAARALQTMTRFIGELRRERATIKSELESQPTRATKERLDASRHTVEELRIELERVTQKLRSAEGALRSQVLAETSQARLGRLIAEKDQPGSTAKDVKLRREQLHRLVESYLPHMAEGAHSVDTWLLTLRQDSFALDYHADDYTMLGMIIKYAGEFGMAVAICGTNGETRSKGFLVGTKPFSECAGCKRRMMARQSKPARKRSWLHRLFFRTKVEK